MENSSFDHVGELKNENIISQKVIICDKDANPEDKEKSYSYEEAVALIGNGKFHLFQFLVCGLCLMAIVNETLSIGMLIPNAKCDIDFSLSEQGILASAAFLGIVCSSPMWGLLADTWGRLKVLRISVLLSTICSIISAFSNSVWMLSAFRFLVGFAISGCQSAVFSYLGEFHSMKSRPKFVLYLSTFLPLGLVYIPGIAIGILPLEIGNEIFGMKFSSWRLFLLLNSLPILIALVLLPFLPESPKYHLVQGQHTKAIRILQKCFQWNTNRPQHDYPVNKIILGQSGNKLSNIKGCREALRIIWSQLVPIFEKNKLLTTLNLIFMMFLCFSIAHGIFLWFPDMIAKMVANITPNMTFCEAINYGSEDSINATIAKSANMCPPKIDMLTYELIILMGFFYTAFYFIVGTLINAVGKKRLLFLWMMITGLCGIGMYWTKGLYLNFIFSFMTLSVGNCGGILSSIAVDIYPTNVNAMAVCLIMMAARLGAFIGGNVVGLIMVYDCNMLFVGSGVIIILCSVLSFQFPNKSYDEK